MGDEGGAMLGSFEVLGHIVRDNQVVGITTEPSYGEYDVLVVLRYYTTPSPNCNNTISSIDAFVHSTSWPLETNCVR